MITSTSSRQVKNVIQLMKKSRIRNAQQCFVVEGLKMFQEVPAELLQQIYVSRSLQQKSEIQKLLEPFADCTETVEDHVLRAMSETKTPQGILCIVKQPSYTLADMFRNHCVQLLLLEDLQDPGNLGTIIRTGEGAGIDGIILSRGSVDIYNPKVVRATMGSIFRVPFIYTESLEQTIWELKEKNVKIYAAHLGGEKFYSQENYTKNTAFLVGNEGNGLTETTAALADRLIRIPMAGRVESLNAAIACSVLMYEVSRQRMEEVKAD